MFATTLALCFVMVACGSKPKEEEKKSVEAQFEHYEDALLEAVKTDDSDKYYKLMSEFDAWYNGLNEADTAKADALIGDSWLWMELYEEGEEYEEEQFKIISPIKVYPVPDISKAQYNTAQEEFDMGIGQNYNMGILENAALSELYYCDWYGEYEYNEGVIKQVRASSTLGQQGKVAYSAGNANDLNHETVWCEGVDGNGIGEYIEYTFSANSPRVTTVKIFNGYVKSLAQWQKNARVKQLMVYYNDTALAQLELEDSRSLQIFNIGTVGSKDSWRLRFEILDVYPGTAYEDTVISEIFFGGNDEMDEDDEYDDFDEDFDEDEDYEDEYDDFDDDFDEDEEDEYDDDFDEQFALKIDRIIDLIYDTENIKGGD